MGKKNKTRNRAVSDKKKAWQELREKLGNLYIEDMEDQVDKIFEYATYHLDWDWNQLADAAGLTRTCVTRLGDRITQRPHHMTFFKLACAVGLRMVYIEPESGNVITNKILKAMQRDYKLAGGQEEPHTLRIAKMA